MNGTGTLAIARWGVYQQAFSSALHAPGCPTRGGGEPMTAERRRNERKWWRHSSAPTVGGHVRLRPSGGNGSGGHAWLTLRGWSTSVG